jgi:hypothetical protein
MRKAVFVLLLVLGSLVGYAQTENYAILTVHKNNSGPTGGRCFIISYGGDNNEIIDFNQFWEKGDDIVKTESIVKMNAKLLELFQKIEAKGYTFSQMGTQDDYHKEYIFKKK